MPLSAAIVGAAIRHRQRAPDEYVTCGPDHRRTAQHGGPAT
ncbi:hypothetical protein [Dactylosporangium fulvum]|uniref:Uncharacterized protein n=1 Tax=Dactylosporangium fulvum TaxID=53359 RepID=A0ABY5WE39_9ACTN|nr:hypothetical protein [Dactylosporangium fulvum]UWP87146.1 hypothetical protein Dfulv_24045 [Dactylosporangium fulvum]